MALLAYCSLRENNRGYGVPVPGVCNFFTSRGIMPPIEDNPIDDRKWLVSPLVSVLFPSLNPQDSTADSNVISKTRNFPTFSTKSPEIFPDSLMGTVGNCASYLPIRGRCPGSTLSSPKAFIFHALACSTIPTTGHRTSTNMIPPKKNKLPRHCFRLKKNTKVRRAPMVIVIPAKKRTSPFGASSYQAQKHGGGGDTSVERDVKFCVYGGVCVIGGRMVCSERYERISVVQKCVRN